MFDNDRIKKFYSSLNDKISSARKRLGRPLTVTEKILHSHLSSPDAITSFQRSVDYTAFIPDRVAMQDATAQMALLQFMNAGISRTAVPSTVHCDHLITADAGSETDLAQALDENREVYEFLQSVSRKYGIGFWRPGAGIIHQIIFENYAFPGGLIIGTDSHTPTAGGLGMIGVGVGGADAVDVMAGMSWELKMPAIIGVKLTGTIRGWTASKDVILHLAGILTVTGGTDAIIQYFGDGASSITATGKATICNMGAEVGATASVFPYDDAMRTYLSATGRQDIVSLADAVADNLRDDPEIAADPGAYFDRVIEIDLDTLEPHINGPFTPDAAHPLSEFGRIVAEKGYPRKVDVGLVGSCTNSSYEDLSRAASIASEASDNNITVPADFIVTPGSEMIRRTAERDGLLQAFDRIGGTIMANACGPCIGQWKRRSGDGKRENTIVTSFNRNFAKRNDGNPNTHCFVASPELVTALTIAGDLTFNPESDSLITADGSKIMLSAPRGAELPPSGFHRDGAGYIAPAERGDTVKVRVNEDSERLQLLKPFPPSTVDDFTGLALLVKVAGKCTTDHISMAGPWLAYRGHLDRISDNLLLGAVNSFTGETGTVVNQETGEYASVPDVARFYKECGVGSCVIAEENYGEGSSREHAAMEPRHLNVRVIIAKSFARIHETNLKKQGILALTFTDKADYARIREHDRIDVVGLSDFAPGRPLLLKVSHSDGGSEEISVRHSYNDLQIQWFKAGSALNLISKAGKAK